MYLIENDRMASVAIRLAPSLQGHGYGTEALAAITDFCFEKTELKRLWTEVDIRNVPSQRMLAMRLKDASEVENDGKDTCSAV